MRAAKDDCRIIWQDIKLVWNRGIQLTAKLLWQHVITIWGIKYCLKDKTDKKTLFCFVWLIFFEHVCASPNPIY